jgi:hypothetical protein
LVELERGVEMEDVGGDVLWEEVGDAVELETLASDQARGEGNGLLPRHGLLRRSSPASNPSS